MNLERITLDSAVMSGKPCIRGLRVTVANVLRQLANHRTHEEILAAYEHHVALQVTPVIAASTEVLHRNDGAQALTMHGK